MDELQLLHILENDPRTDIRDLADILNESEATITEKQDKLYVTYYNLEAVIFLSFRINTYCTKLFREWVLNSLCEYKRLKEKQPEVLVVFNASDNQTFISYN